MGGERGMGARGKEERGREKDRRKVGRGWEIGGMEGRGRKSRGREEHLCATCTSYCLQQWSHVMRVSGHVKHRWICVWPWKLVW